MSVNRSNAAMYALLYLVLLQLVSFNLRSAASNVIEDTRGEVKRLNRYEIKKMMKKCGEKSF